MEVLTDIQLINLSVVARPTFRSIHVIRKPDFNPALFMDNITKVNLNNSSSVSSELIY